MSTVSCAGYSEKLNKFYSDIRKKHDIFNVVVVFVKYKSTIGCIQDIIKFFNRDFVLYFPKLRSYLKRILKILKYLEIM